MYGWWFRTVPADIDISGCVQRDGLTLLYAGISPKRPPANGKPRSSQNLRQRITYHYRGNADGSTLRNSFARGMLDPDRSAQLEELPGWTWGPRAGRSKGKTTTPGAT